MTLADRCYIAGLPIAALVLLALAAPAAAQSVEAEALFRDGKRLLKEGKLAEACDKFEASERLETSVGTLLNLADCREKNGQLATAWAAFLKAEATAKRAGNDAKRQAEAKKRAKALEGRLSYLTVSVPESSKVEGLAITRNGTPIDAALWNTGTPVDPGTYVIKAQAPGHEPWSTEVTVAGEAQKASVEVPRFKRIQDLTPDPVVTPPDGEAKAPPPPPDDEPVDPPGRGGGTFTPMRWGAVGAGVIGLAAIGAGVVFGLEAKDLQSQADELCPEAACDDMEAIRLNNDAQSEAMRANVSFAVGGLAVAGAVALWIIGAPDEAAPGDVSFRPVVGGDRVGFAFGGSF
jgi:tetratricopeptide (TPR) repeat protein